VKIVELELPGPLEGTREELMKQILAADGRIKTFAMEHNWQAFVNPPLVKSLRVLSSKASFDEAVLSAFNLDNSTNIPKTAVAVVAGEELLMIPPEIYMELYPQGHEKDYYLKLIVHELAHVLHIRILNGDEEKMGPKWFYEGFALYAANQFAGSKSELSMDEIREVILSDKDECYKTYKEVIEKVLEKTELAKLVERAGEADFSDWIASILVG
jgi:hypothetical protein